MLVRIESGLKTVMQAFRVFDTEGRPVKFKNSIKYFELDEENVKKLKELKLDKKYDGKIKKNNHKTDPKRKINHQPAVGE